MKTCAKCQIEKEETDFTPSQLKRTSGWCKNCVSASNKKWVQENPDKVAAACKKWRHENPEKAAAATQKWAQENSEKIMAYQKKRRQENPEIFAAKNKKWRQENPERAVAGQQKWRKENPEKATMATQKWRQENPEKIVANRKKRYKTDPVYRNRQLASWMVWSMLKSQKTSKSGLSSSYYFPWTPEELWNHLLKCMQEPGNEWMHKDNQGKYDPKTWDDNDRETWTWQLDHIIPQNILPYDSMEHPNFKKCWDLSNLRPLSAKQNVLDGVKRIRHH